MGNSVVYSLFGESHGPLVGMTIHNLPAGITLDQQAIRNNLTARQTGGMLTSQRRESDEVEWVSGVIDSVTTGAPLSFIIKNNDYKSQDYRQIRHLVRPSHADYTAYVKYDGFNDKSGGGMFSGRLTSCYVVAGSIVKQLLSPQINFKAHLIQLGKLSLPKDISGGGDKCWLDSLASPWRGMVVEYLSDIQGEGDSVGGQVNLIIDGVPAGIGEPLFYSVESVLSSWFFVIPGLKAVQFGDGVALAGLKGSVANDIPYYEDGQLKHRSNRNGGVLGGISNGMPLDITVTFKPTSSIYKAQQTVDLVTQQNSTIELTGRHDPAYVIRTPIVVESVAAMALYDLVRMAQR